MRKANRFFDVSRMSDEEQKIYGNLADKYDLPDKHDSPGEYGDGRAQGDGKGGERQSLEKGIDPKLGRELAELRKYREMAEDRQLGEVAQKYSLLGQKSEVLAKALKRVKNADNEAYEQMISVLNGSLNAVEQAGLFEEIGKRGTAQAGQEGAGAWNKIEQAARGKMKQTPGMRWTDALDAACVAHPQLVEAYEKSLK